MNIIRPIGKYLFLLGALNAWFAASAQVATPSCSASFDILDGSGTAIASISQSGEELTICVGQTLTFVSTSAPSSGSTIADGQWNVGGSVISNLNDQPFQFGQDMTLIVSINISDDEGCQGFASVTINVVGAPGFEFDLEEPSCFGLCNGSLLGTYLSDNASLYTHTWYLQGNEVASGNLSLSACAGSYNVVVTDPAGCTDVDIPFMLDDPDAIEMSITPPGPVPMCPGDNPLTLTAAHPNAATPLQSIAWSWSDGLSVTDQLVTVFTPSSNNLNQMLDINIVDANGCAGSASIYLPSRLASLLGTIEIDGAPM